MKPLSSVLVGCGHIARSYAQELATYPEIALSGFCDLDPARAAAFARDFGGRAYNTLAEVLQDPTVELVVNLTIHTEHETVTRQCLAAGKHVHTEKPVALSTAAAQALADLAAARGVRLSAAPTTWMGEAQQAAADVLRSAELGAIRQVFAEINHGRIESWHPNPGPFYGVGVLWDVCIYPVTLLTAFLGPVTSVQAMQRTLLPERRTLDGAMFRIARPDFVVALLDFADGPAARLSGNFYNVGSRQGSSVEFHGDAGSLVLESSFFANAGVDRTRPGQDPEPVPRVAESPTPIPFARGVRELARAIAEGRPHAASAAQAIHVIEILEAIDRSAAAGGNRENVHSTFVRPGPVAL